MNMQQNGNVLELLEKREIGLFGVMPLLYAGASWEEEINLDLRLFLIYSSMLDHFPSHSIKRINRHDWFWRDRSLTFTKDNYQFSEKHKMEIQMLLSFRNFYPYSFLPKKILWARGKWIASSYCNYRWGPIGTSQLLGWNRARLSPFPNRISL